MKINNYFADINAYRILRIVWENKGITRTEIAKKLKLDKSTVTNHISEFQKKGIIHEIAQGETGPQGGRKPIFLEVSPDFSVVGGIEINSEYFVCTLLDLQGKILFQYQERITAPLFAEQKLKGIFNIAYNLLKQQARTLRLPLFAIAVGLPGCIDPSKGIVYTSFALQIYEKYNFIDDIKDITDIPVFIENDARCCCYSEVLALEKTPENMLFLLLEYRLKDPVPDAEYGLVVGIGLIINGEILKGPDSTAGEFRSILLENNATSQLKKFLPLNLYKNTENTEIPAFRELAKHIAFLMNTLNLNKVYIGGIDVAPTKTLTRYIEEEKDRFTPPHIPKGKVSIQRASFGNLSVCYGAACMLLEKIFPKATLLNNENNLEKTLNILSTITKSS